jgi:hypothetical protein
MSQAVDSQEQLPVVGLLEQQVVLDLQGLQVEVDLLLQPVEVDLLEQPMQLVGDLRVQEQGVDSNHLGAVDFHLSVQDHPVQQMHIKTSLLR